MIGKSNMKDTITRILLKVLTILFIYNVQGTCYGCLFGLTLLSMKSVLAEFFPIIALIKWYGFITFGVLGFNIIPIIKKKYEDPVIETQLKYIREIMKESNLSDKEKRACWRKVIENILKTSSENMNNTNKKDDFENNLFD